MQKGRALLGSKIKFLLFAWPKVDRCGTSYVNCRWCKVGTFTIKKSVRINNQMLLFKKYNFEAWVKFNPMTRIALMALWCTYNTLSAETADNLSRVAILKNRCLRMGLCNLCKYGNLRVRSKKSIVEYVYTIIIMWHRSLRKRTDALLIQKKSIKLSVIVAP